MVIVACSLQISNSCGQEEIFLLFFFKLLKGFHSRSSIGSLLFKTADTVMKLTKSFDYTVD